MVQVHEQKTVRAKARILATNENYDDLLEMAKAKAPDPTVFDEFAPAFWSATISSNRVDHYKTAMSRDTLENFVEGLNTGVSFQGNHNWHKLGFGQSIYGEMTETDEEVEHVGQNLLEVNGTFVTLSGIQTQEGSTDDFLAMIRSGSWRDVSVGFYPKEYACSICGLDPWDWWSDDYCEHIPGVTYKEDGKNQMAFVWINGADLLEVSQVYDGASPGAEVNNVVTKAQALANERMIGEREIVAVENMFHTRIQRPGLIVPASSLKAESLSREEADMKRVKGTSEPVVEDAEVTGVEDEQVREPVATEEETEELEATAGQELEEASVETEPGVDDEEETTFEFDDEDDEDGDEEDEEEERAVAEVTIHDVLTESEIGALSERGIRLGKNVGRAIHALADALMEERKRSRENAAMAEIGRKQRDIAIEETLRSGTRAFGGAFDQERQRKILSNMSYDDIRHMQETYEQQVEDKFKRTPPVNMSVLDPNDSDGETPVVGVRSRERFRA